MANPRKFSEKIALHNQKQAEETAAFDAIMREVTATTRHVQSKPHAPQQMHLTQPQLGIYRGGSLPNVNQTTIDLQAALHSLEDMKQATGRQSLIDRYHRQRQLQSNRRQFPFDKRTDCSPYGTTYLSPPLDTNWRRTNSDSALHTSTLCQQLCTIEVPGEPVVQRNSLGVYTQHGRPKSCEVPGINIYPSPEQGQSIPIANNTGSLPDLTTIQFPSPLTMPLDKEELEGTCYKVSGNNSALSVAQQCRHSPETTTPTETPPTSPCSSCTSPQAGSSSVILQGNMTQIQQNSNVSSQATAFGTNIACFSSDNNFQQYHRFPEEAHSLNKGEVCYTSEASQNSCIQYAASKISSANSLFLKSANKSIDDCATSVVNSSGLHVSQQDSQTFFDCPDSTFMINSQQQQLFKTNVTNSPKINPQIVISSADHDDSVIKCEPTANISSSVKNCFCSEDSSEHQVGAHSYRNSHSDCPPSPNSPVSPQSFSPSQSPGLPTTTVGESTFCDSKYYNQQQIYSQATNALQHQFEQFNMMQENPVTSIYNRIANVTNYSQANPITTVSFSSNSRDDNLMQAIAVAQQNHSTIYNSTPILNSNMSNHDEKENTCHSPQPPGSPQQPGSSDSQQQIMSENTLPLTPQEVYPNLTPNISTQTQKKIPNITLTGADDLLTRHDFAKDLGSAMASISDFDAELFPSDEALKIGLDPLDLDGLQMLTDPTMVTDPATEDSFRLDRL